MMARGGCQTYSQTTSALPTSPRSTAQHHAKRSAAGVVRLTLAGRRRRRSGGDNSREPALGQNRGGRPVPRGRRKVAQGQLPGPEHAPDPGDGVRHRADRHALGVGAVSPPCSSNPQRCANAEFGSGVGAMSAVSLVAHTERMHVGVGVGVGAAKCCSPGPIFQPVRGGGRLFHWPDSATHV